jgi:hypothetical protein
MPLDPNPTPTPAAPAAAQAAATPPPAEAPAPAAGTPPAAPQPAFEPKTVPVPYEDFQRFLSAQNRLAALEQEKQQREEASLAERTELLLKKGEVEKALNEIQARSKAREEELLRAKVAAEDMAKRHAIKSQLGSALSFHPLVPGAVDQLMTLWQGNLNAVQEGDGFSVRTPDYAPVSEFVKSQFTKPEYAHFLRPSSAGGTAGTGAAQSPPTPAANPTPAPEPKNFSEALILQFQADRQKQAAQPAALDPKQGFGLKPAVRTG